MEVNLIDNVQLTTGLKENGANQSDSSEHITALVHDLNVLENPVQDEVYTNKELSNDLKCNSEGIQKSDLVGDRVCEENNSDASDKKADIMCPSPLSEVHCDDASLEDVPSAEQSAQLDASINTDQENGVSLTPAYLPRKDCDEVPEVPLENNNPSPKKETKVKQLPRFSKNQSKLKPSRSVEKVDQQKKDPHTRKSPSSSASNVQTQNMKSHRPTTGAKSPTQPTAVLPPSNAVLPPPAPVTTPVSVRPKASSYGNITSRYRSLESSPKYVMQREVQLARRRALEKKNEIASSIRKKEWCEQVNSIEGRRRADQLDKIQSNKEFREVSERSRREAQELEKRELAEKRAQIQKEREEKKKRKNLLNKEQLNNTAVATATTKD